MVSLIRNKTKILRRCDFTKMIRGKVYPSDIDAIIELRGKVFIIIEYKEPGGVIPTGQRLMLENLCDTLSLAAHAIVLVAEHGEVVDNLFDGATAMVREYRFNGRWTPPQKQVDVQTAVDLFVNKTGAIKCNDTTTSNPRTTHTAAYNCPTPATPATAAVTSTHHAA